jgi:hypothetical protein
VTTTLAQDFPVLHAGDKRIHNWTVPFTGRRPVVIPAHRGSAGFALIHAAMFWDEEVEPLDLPGPRDEWGIAFRPIRGGQTPSKHSRGVAIDLNATRHPRGVPIRKTFDRGQVEAINHYLRAPSRDGLLVWGGWWPSHKGSTTPPDGMHLELSDTTGMRLVEQYARHMCESKARRVNAILEANPGQRKVIYS